MSTPDVILPQLDPSLGCNCQYPIGLVIFLIFTILSLLICICICCFDILRCCIFKKSEDVEQKRSSSFDPRLFDSSKFTSNKHSLDPRHLEYTHLLSSSNSSSNSRSIDFSTTSMYAGDTSLVTTV